MKREIEAGRFSGNWEEGRDARACILLARAVTSGLLQATDLCLEIARTSPSVGVERHAPVRSAVTAVLQVPVVCHELWYMWPNGGEATGFAGSGPTKNPGLSLWM